MAKLGSEGNVVIPAESAEAIKQNLRQVADELVRVRDRAREEADSLDRIRGMLDLKYLNDLLSVIDQLEARVKQVESGAETKRARIELENEQKRLAKLWDAFKTQEDQIKALERERDEALQQYRSLEKQIGELGSPASIRQRMAAQEADNERYSSEASLTASKLEKYVELFTHEQERLAKLYKVYEDTESKYQALLKKQKPAPIAGPRPARRATAAPKAKKPDRRAAYKRELAAFKKRASKRPGGKGRYEDRAGAKTLKRKYGIK